jgi:uncharacterized membrane protein YkvA (DUF1232 family)
MSPLESRCLEQFPSWLRSLTTDARALCQVLESDADEPLRKSAAVALNYLFKSIDLIPDGLEDLGYLDDAFVFRACAARAAASSALAAESELQRLSNDVELIREFLGPDFEHLERYVAALGDRPVRGRSVAALLEDADMRSELVRDVQSWAASFESPNFLRDAKSLVKLRSFLSTRLSPPAS